MNIQRHAVAVAVTLDGKAYPVASWSIDKPEPGSCVGPRITLRGRSGCESCAAGMLVNVSLATTCRAWQFPADRFVEYEQSDEAWARPLGFGREVDVQSEMRAQCAVVECDQECVRLEVLSVSCECED